MKNPLTLAGIEPATFWFVSQHLNHCATVVPHILSSVPNPHANLMEWKEVAQNRDSWKKVVEQARTLYRL